MKQLEAHLQANIVLRFHNVYKGDGVLLASCSELLSSSIGGKLRSLGMIKACPDLTFICHKEHYGIELKFADSRHNTKHLIEQGEFLKHNYKHGWFVTTEDDFFRLVDLIESGAELPPSNVDAVLSACKNAKGGSIKWDYELFKIF